MQAEILEFWAFPGGFWDTTVYFEQFFDSLYLLSDKNILYIREYSREYKNIEKGMK